MVPVVWAVGGGSGGSATKASDSSHIELLSEW